MDALSDAVERLKRDEGWRAFPYLDTEGVWTIGYGFTQVHGRRVSAETPVMTQRYAVRLLQARAAQARNDARLAVPGYDDLSADRRSACIQLAYNLGHGGLLGFVGFLSAMGAGRYDAAALELQDSLWRDQVGRGRAGRICRQIRHTVDEHHVIYRTGGSF